MAERIEQYLDTVGAQVRWKRVRPALTQELRTHLEEQAEALIRVIGEKKIALRIFCGADDEDCLPLAKQLYAAAQREGLDAAFTIQENSRHQFPAELYTVKDLW